MISTRTVDSYEADAGEGAGKPRGGLAGVWRSHKDVLGGAGSLVASTAVTSGLGFAFWTVAARMFPQQAVGYGSAATSAMALLGTFGMFGLGTVLIAELPRRSPRAGLVSAALLTSGIGSLIIGLGFALVAPHFSHNFAGIGGTPQRVALFSVGVALTGVGLVFDQGTIGLLRGGLQLSRNMAFTTAKLLALPAAALLLHDEFGVGIDLAWIGGIAASMLVVAVILRIGGDPILPRPEWDVLRGLGKTAMAHNWLNIAISVPWSVIPVLVTVVVSPTANAAFYAAWTLSGFLYVIPTHLSTVLFAVAAGDVKATAHKLRFTLKLSVLIGVPGMIVLGVGAHLALSMFGAGYARLATVPLWLLVLGYLPAIPRMHYIAVCRAANRITKAAVVLTSFSAAEIAAAAVGGALHGLDGLSVALLAVFTIEAIAVTPAVLGTAMGRGRHRGVEQAAAGPTTGRRAAPQATGAIGPPARMPRPPARRQPVPAAAGAVRAGAVAEEAHTRPVRNHDLQEAGLAALLSLSGFVSRTGPIPVVSNIPPVPQGRRPARSPAARRPDRGPGAGDAWGPEPGTPGPAAARPGPERLPRPPERRPGPPDRSPTERWSPPERRSRPERPSRGPEQRSQPQQPPRVPERWSPPDGEPRMPEQWAAPKPEPRVSEPSTRTPDRADREARPGGGQHRRPERLPRPPDRAPSPEERWPDPAERRSHRRERWPEPQEHRFEHEEREERWPRPTERRSRREERVPARAARDDHADRDESAQMDERDEQDQELASLRSLAMYATQTLPLRAIRDYVPPDRRDVGRSRRR
jgi:O-antigen/teichoic acid export membrane protein